MIAWKAVGIDDVNDRFQSWSFVVDHKPVIYKVGITSKRHSGWGPLTAFKSLRHARRFVKRFRHGCNYAIIKCSVTKSHAKRIWLIDCYNNILANLATAVTPNKLKLPSGTVLCDSITPLKVIERFQ